ncbi:MAG: putative nicotinamide N-methyase [Oleiphilaceae bacterium]|jgi:predicted nicotinamide N-methyase
MININKLNDNLHKTLAKGRVALSQPAGCPKISLYLFDPHVLEGPLSHDEALAVVAEPAYWSFCWASGQVLAHFILTHPETVKNKVVVDVGSGSGVVAIAAAMAGAKSVYACDIDDDALDATRMNSQANKVIVHTIKDLSDVGETIDLITAADVLYDRDNFSLLTQFTELAPKVLLADSRVKKLPVDDYILQTTIEARTWPDLNEFEEFNQVRIYALSH